MKFPEVGRVHTRCAACEGPAPADIAAPVVETRPSQPMTGGMTPLMAMKPNTRGGFRRLADDQADRWSPYKDGKD